MTERALVLYPFLEVASVTPEPSPGAAAVRPETVVCKRCLKEIYSAKSPDCKVQWLLIPEHFETHGIKVEIR